MFWKDRWSTTLTASRRQGSAPAMAPWFRPKGSTRRGTSAGGNAAELATYIVEKGKPFLVAVD